tara:strand:- start:191 stop:976 length:786 start_codon:yes stop_codon:yes gene_type:complete
MKKINLLKLALKEGKHVFGTWSNIPSPNVTNILSNSGMDFIIIDLEHGPTTYETLEYQIYAADSERVTPIVRLSDSTEKNILHVLEVGAQSILISHVNSALETEKIVKSTRYSPDGNRGISLFTRNHGYSDKDFKYKMQNINEQIFTSIIIEGEEGINNLENICSIKNLDMVYLGIYDISQTLGVPGDVKNKKVINLIKDLVKMIESHGVVAGSIAPDREYIKFLIESGFRFISYRADSAVLLDGFSTANSWFQKIINDLA